MVDDQTILKERDISEEVIKFAVTVVRLSFIFLNLLINNNIKSGKRRFSKNIST